MNEARIPELKRWRLPGIAPLTADLNLDGAPDRIHVN